MLGQRFLMQDVDDDAVVCDATAVYYLYRSREGTAAVQCGVTSSCPCACQDRHALQLVVLVSAILSVAGTTVMGVLFLCIPRLRKYPARYGPCRCSDAVGLRPSSMPRVCHCCGWQNHGLPWPVQLALVPQHIVWHGGCG